MDLIKSENWGPYLWYLMHSISYNYPERPTQQQKIIYGKFYYKIIPTLILCKYCLYHYKNFLKKKNIDFNSKENLINWVINLHNDVNLENNKLKYTRLDVDKLYFKKNFNHKYFYKFLTYYTSKLTNKQVLFNYIEFLKVLSVVLPCKGCKTYIIKNYKNRTDIECYNKITQELSNNLGGKHTCLSI